MVRGEGRECDIRMTRDKTTTSSFMVVMVCIMLVIVSIMVVMLPVMVFMLPVMVFMFVVMVDMLPLRVVMSFASCSRCA